MRKLIRNSTVLITGGTGTFGSAFLEHILKFEPKEIRIFSRDEKKQYELQNKYNNYEKIKFYIGDIRNFDSIDKAMRNVDFVLHAAAMKQVPACEQNPIEALKTNVLGSDNVLEASIKNKVKKVVCISTDKAVNPTSVMGITKLYMEKIALAKAKEQDHTKICIVRFCNLFYSNGSVVPLFINQIKENKPLTITVPKMVRYFITTKQAINLIETAFMYGKSGEIYIKDGQPCTLGELAKAILKFFNKPCHPIVYIGARQGEKIEEQLYTKSELDKITIKKGCLVIGEQEGSGQQLSPKPFLETEDLFQMIKEEVNEASSYYS